MSATRREMRTLLELAATRGAREPDRGFRIDLERRLVTTVPPGRLVALPNAPRRARRPGVLSGAVAATAAVVLAGALTGVYGQGADDQRLALAVAVDTVVQLPDGTMVPGERGLALPDGTVVRTGPNGHCAAGDVELGPGLEALVDAGHLRLRMVDPVGTAGAPATPTPTVSDVTPVTVPPTPAATRATDSQGAVPTSAPAAGVPASR